MLQQTIETRRVFHIFNKEINSSSLGYTQPLE